MNYTFDFVGQGRNQTYYFVFDSTSTTAPTDVLVRSSFQAAPDSTVTTVPAALVGIGAVLALVGAKVGGKKVETKAENLPRDAPSAPDSAASAPRCRFCGGTLDESSKFCSSCGRSQG